MPASAYEKDHEGARLLERSDRRNMKQILSVIAILTLSSAAANAQTCMGGTELGRGAHRLSVGGTMADGTNGAGAGYGFGSDHFFGTAGLGFNRFTGADQTQVAVSTLFGAQLRAGTGAAIAVCPVGQYDMGFGPNVDPVSLRTHAIAGGARIGFATGDPEQFNVVPTAGLSLVRSGLRASNDLLGINQTMWDTYGLANMGVGFRFNHSRMAVVPSVSFPIGLDGVDPSFGVTFNSNF
jgi:hypothetical protein